MLTVPADLYPLATMGLVVTHWRPFIDRLLGGYTRFRTAPPSDGQQMTPPSGMLAAYVPDSSESEDDDADQMPIIGQ